MTSTLSDALSNRGFDDKDVVDILSAMDRHRIGTCLDCPCCQFLDGADYGYCQLVDRAIRHSKRLRRATPPAWCPLRSKPVLLEVTT